MYKLIIFDLDGTLANTDLLVVDAFLQIFKKYRPTYKPTFKELTLLSGPTLSESFDKYFPNEDKNKLIDEFKILSKPMYITHACLYPGALEMLLKLKSQNYKLAILTNKAHSATSNSLNLYNCYEIFDEVISFDDIQNPKPSPDGILLLKEKFGLDLKDILYVGDSQIDSLTAKNADVDCCLVTWNVRGKLPNVEANYFASTLDELMEVINHE